jgi:glycosyltransferase involved in cell wall biosynthesis
MKFLIITHVLHQVNQGNISAYGPYVREMNLWLNHVDEVVLVAPKTNKSKGLIDLPYNHDNLNFKAIQSIEFTSVRKTFSSLLKLPLIVFKIFKACLQADHIHLRCPGNMGLLGCLIQVFFPSKPKTAKYAGNWDPDSKQPWSYQFQKWILSNTFLTKNIDVLVYGDWKNQTKNIKSFFTASFYKKDVEKILPRDYSKELNFIFIGSLVEGKRPLLSIKIIEELLKEGKEVTLNIYGNGILKAALQDYVLKNNLTNAVKFLGNQSKETIKGALKSAHFLLLPSKSEGWPKAVAEAMFFGVVPITTKVSCISDMLNNGNRGIIIGPELNEAISELKKVFESNRLPVMSQLAANWSQKYTLQYFESEIKNLLIEQ